MSLTEWGWVIAIADANGDGPIDLILASGDGIQVLLGSGRGTFVPAEGSPFASGKGSWRLVVGDWNNDGKVDVATSNLESGMVTVLLGH